MVRDVQRHAIDVKAAQFPWKAVYGGATPLKQGAAFNTGKGRMLLLLYK